MDGTPGAANSIASSNIALMIEDLKQSPKIPTSSDQVTITLGEGNTPLLRAPRVSERLGVEVWLKWEGANPTGSFKDRGMSVAVTRAVEGGATTIVSRCPPSPP